MEAIVLWFLAGLCAGAGLGLLALRHRARQVDGLRGELARFGVERARLQAEVDLERKASAEKLSLLQQTEGRLRDMFGGLSAEALRTNNRAFLELAQGSLLQPVGAAFDKLQAAIDELEKQRVGSYSALREAITALASSQHDLRAETANLVKALRSPATRGRWGEIQLRRVCELAGMLEHCDFDEQHTTWGDERRLRPDVQVRLPGGRTVVVDAKVPIQAYLEAAETPDEGLRALLLREHARQVREHVAKLGGKAYWEQFASTPDFVVMFMPGEPFLSAAWEADPSLVESALEQRVMLATPVTLIALLKAVAWGWRQEALADNARTVSELGRALHGRLLRLAGHFDGLGKGLNHAVAAYNRAVGSLEHRVLVAARRFEDLGVACAEPIPELRPVERVARAPLLEPLLTGTDGD